MLQKTIILLLTLCVQAQVTLALQKTEPNQATLDLIGFIKHLPAIGSTQDKSILDNDEINTLNNYISQGADVNHVLISRHSKSYPLLHYSISKDITAPEFFKILLKAGADPLAKDYSGRTALMFFDKRYSTTIPFYTEEPNQERTAFLARLRDIVQILNAENNPIRLATQAIDQSDAGQLPGPVQRTVLSYLYGGEQQDYLPENLTRSQNVGSNLAQLHTQLLTLSAAAA